LEKKKDQCVDQELPDELKIQGANGFGALTAKQRQQFRMLKIQGAISGSAVMFGLGPDARQRARFMLAGTV
jgi:hypothetical protein